MCDCGRNECSFCTNQVALWVRWQLRVEEILKEHQPHTRDGLDLRLGQVLYNVLSYYRQDIAYQISGSLIDPFHNDDNVPAFLEKVDELWTT